ncbi:hypothetical protein JCM10914A_42390 [Paenibacillus sp. JCM 10914]|uniref:DUF4367 domain-containing protein n=1 Tax=Paenibacillus sp. JCM 10914 TaxID=1236974 RepID=UPI0003CC7688|nr:DUF4367 domain-containing protein [Paenibacillus sp. JCM 10914]GAE05456.1 hypothetical protein JCM10914_1558 [Paenibacillus sp. JCM 10914]
MSNGRYDDDRKASYSEAFDDAFDEAFEHAASRSSYPMNEESKRQSWQKMKQQIDGMKKRRRRRHYIQIAGIIAASMALGAVLFAPTTMTQAVTPVYHEIRDWGNGIVGQVFGRRTPETGIALTPPPPDYEAGPVTSPADQEAAPDHDVPPAEVVDVDTTEFIETDEALPESRKRAQFQIPVFEYIPDEFKFYEANALLIGDNSQFDELNLQYKNNKDQFLHINMLSLEGDKQLGVGGKIVDTIKLDNGKAVYIREHGVTLLHNNDQLVVTINGVTTTDELIKIAENMK